MHTKLIPHSASPQSQAVRDVRLDRGPCTTPAAKGVWITHTHMESAYGDVRGPHRSILWMPKST